MLLEKNQIITLTITALTNEGNGVGHYICEAPAAGEVPASGGIAVFVPFTAVGDVISCRIVKTLKSYAYGKIEEIITPSPDRVKQDCPVYGKCGGCCFRHISYEAELRAKQRFVEDAFSRIGGMSSPDIFLPIKGSDLVNGYRNKLQMPFGTETAGRRIIAGFYSERSHRVIPVDGCMLQLGAGNFAEGGDIFSEITRFVCGQAEKLRISVYNEERHEGVLRHIYLRRGNYSGEICLCLVAKRAVPEFKPLARAVAERFPQITGIVLNINKRDSNVILGDEERILFGSEIIHDMMCGVRVEISPKSFYQVNTPAAEALYRQAAEFAKPAGRVILDLYCGAGTIGLSMAHEAKKIIGAEIVPEAIENAKRNAEINGMDNVEFICADAEAAAEKLRTECPDVIMLDPPRKGCSEKTLEICAGMRPERIVMISCNPATAARDCKRLSDAGYEIKKIRAFDLFPRTRHVETVVLMSL